VFERVLLPVPLAEVADKGEEEEGGGEELLRPTKDQFRIVGPRKGVEGKEGKNTEVKRPTAPYRAFSLIRPAAPRCSLARHAHQLRNMRTARKTREAFQLQGMSEGGGEGHS